MSFLRPEAARTLRRFRETLVWAGVLMGLLWVLVRIWPGAHWVVLAAIVCLAGAACLAAANALIAAVLTGRDDAAGVVLVDEARIGYFGPEGGGFVDRDALTRLVLVQGPSGPEHWVLYRDTGDPISIPVGAKGADGLPDAFASLPGLSLPRLMQATRSGAARTVLWQA